MSASSNLATLTKPGGSPQTDGNRRGKRRAKISQLVRVRPSEPLERDFSEVLSTQNVSADGFYFVTHRNCYQHGMRLFVTLPYSLAPGAINLEYIARVVRVDTLDKNRYGVALQLLTTIHMQPSPTSRHICHE